MPQFRSSRRVGYSAQQMFALVRDVESYPSFVPLCTALRVRKRSETPAGEVIVADMEIGYKAIREKFTSKVICNPATMAIDVTYVDGPFRKLHNEWRFVDKPGGCDVEFYIDYEFRNRAFALLMGAVFDRAFRQFADAFEKRAKEIYGERANVAGPDRAPV